MPTNQLFPDWVTGDTITADRLNQMKNDLIPWSQAGQANGLATLDSAGKLVERLSYEGVASGVAKLDANGMPLDANGTPVVAYGSNANGEYVRFADGTQICWAHVILPFLEARRCEGTWIYPAAFLSEPRIIVTLDTRSTEYNYGGDAGYEKLGVTSHWVVGTTSVPITQWTTANDFADGDQVPVDVIAIGRWK